MRNGSTLVQITGRCERAGGGNSWARSPPRQNTGPPVMSEPFMFRLTLPVSAEQARARLILWCPPPRLLPQFVHSCCGIHVKTALSFIYVICTVLHNTHKTFSESYNAGEMPTCRLICGEEGVFVLSLKWLLLLQEKL